MYVKPERDYIISELSGLSLFAWNNLSIVRNNEIVIDYPKLPRKLNIVMAEENVHEKPEALTEFFTYFDNVKNAMIEEIGGFFKEDLKYMRVHACSMWKPC